MSDLTPSSPPLGGKFLLYQTEDGRTRIQCRFEVETIWLTQAQMAELFQTTPQNVTLHLKAIFAEGELLEAATCKDYLQVRSEGGREVTRKLLKKSHAEPRRSRRFGDEVLLSPRPSRLRVNPPLGETA